MTFIYVCFIFFSCWQIAKRGELSLERLVVDLLVIGTVLENFLNSIFQQNKIEFSITGQFLTLNCFNLKSIFYLLKYASEKICSRSPSPQNFNKNSLDVAQICLPHRL